MYKVNNMRFILFICSVLFLGISAASAENLRASQAENIGQYQPNSFGVYPVRIQWQKDSDSSIQGYHVYRSTSVDSGFEKISTEPVEKESGGFFIYIDENNTAVPGKPYYYRILPFGSGRDTRQFSQTSVGYGALSHEKFLIEFSKAFKSSHKKLTYMHKNGALSKLGSEQKEGNISGILSYNARVVGLSGRVNVNYDNYADLYIDNNKNMGSYIVLTGETITSASISQNGTAEGVISISGMYPGKINFDKILIRNGTTGGGTYGVEPEGFPSVELSWTIGEF